MPQHPEEKNPTTPSASIPAQPDPQRYAQQLLNNFLVHRELTRVYAPGGISEVSSEQMRVWSETYTSQRQHLVDLIAAGIRSGEVLF